MYTFHNNKLKKITNLELIYKTVHLDPSYSYRANCTTDASNPH